jgi:hypothetical protein
VHFHRLFLDGVSVEDGPEKRRFHQVKAPNAEQLRALVRAISHRVAGFPERRELLRRDAENSYLALKADDDGALMPWQSHSITDRFAPNSQHRLWVTPANTGRGRKRPQPGGENRPDETPAERPASMSRMQRAGVQQSLVFDPMPQANASGD